MACRPNLKFHASFLMLVSTISFAIMNASIRDITQELEPLVVVFFRNAFGLLALSPFLLRNGLKTFRTARLGLHGIRAGLNVMAMAFFYVGLSLTPLAEATALAFTAPLFAVMLAVLCLKERVSFTKLLAMGIGFVGALIILRPGFGFTDVGSLWIIISAFIWSGTLIIIKLLARTESSMTITAYMALFLAIMSLPTALIFWQTPSISQFIYLFVIATSGTLGQYTLTEALGRADAQTVMPLDFMRLIWTAFLGYVMFNEVPDAYVWFGATMIFASATYVAIEKKSDDN
ncbi:MAG: RNA polymerase subunit sigma-54 [Rhodospirillaceae bacterium]|nr:RNA polymerase subunit sigma-54 [Rhodospirillaceae bacterium]|tara:strand:- start:24 stop:890 length:867 start_codon:yes stop_codon:yes gene_type:complete